MSVGVILTVIFVIAHILGYIHFSWWLVFLPLVLEVVVDVLFFFGVFSAAVHIFKKL